MGSPWREQCVALSMQRQLDHLQQPLGTLCAGGGAERVRPWCLAAMPPWTVQGFLLDPSEAVTAGRQGGFAGAASGLPHASLASGSLSQFWRCWRGSSFAEGCGPGSWGQEHGGAPGTWWWGPWDLVVGLGPDSAPAQDLWGSTAVPGFGQAVEQERSSPRSQRLLASSVVIAVVQLGQKQGRGCQGS